MKELHIFITGYFCHNGIEMECMRMENRVTREIVIDGTFFSNFKEFYELMHLLVCDGTSEEEATLSGLQRMLEAHKEYYILLVWENADLSRITFGFDAAAQYYEKHKDDDPEYAWMFEGSAEQRGRSLYGVITEILMRQDLGYLCELNAVDGLRMADYEFHVSSLSDTYEVTAAQEKDIPELIALYNENEEYFRQLEFETAEEAVRNDMVRLPEGCDPDNKHFVIFRDPDVIAAADIFLHYPRQDAVWIDLIMLSKDLQGFSYGSEILRDILDAFAKCGFMWAEAGFIKGNISAEKFFHRNWFVDLHRESDEGGQTYHHMIRGLQ